MCEADSRPLPVSIIQSRNNVIQEYPLTKEKFERIISLAAKAEAFFGNADELLGRVGVSNLKLSKEGLSQIPEDQLDSLIAEFNTIKDEGSHLLRNAERLQDAYVFVAKCE